MRILADASLPGLGAAFPAPFRLQTYTQPQELAALLKGQEILLCRSTLKVDSKLLLKHQLRCVATASSGVDHLDLNFLKAQQIEVFDAKGSNAASVADYVLACLAYLDKNKLIQGKKAGLIGLGAVGTAVHQRLIALGFEVEVYDPPKAQREPSFQSCKLETLYEQDLLCIHAALDQSLDFPSTNLLDEAFLAQIKPGCLMVNASRGGIVNEQALLKTGRESAYCTDVYLNEPQIDKVLIAKALLCTPHIAGHSLESKWRAVRCVSRKIHQAFKLPLPLYDYPPAPLEVPALAPNQTWQDLILALYNPMKDTLSLKKAKDKRSAFLSLRAAHQQRHDFSCYGTYFAGEELNKLIASPSTSRTQG